ncbi:MAG: hypothetical protein WA421_16975 [Nitrososphaeraceae archaeon]
MNAVNDSRLKTVRIADETHKKIMSCGKMGESMDEVINKVFDYYIERELTRSKK